MDIQQKLIAKGAGSIDWANEWTEVKYLGGTRFAARIYSKPRVFKYNGKWLKHKLIRKADKTMLISANAGVLIKSDGNVALIDPKYRKVRVLREEFVVLAFRERWIPVLATTEENLVKIESFEESDRIYAKITFANRAGELVVEYLLIDGHMLKHNIKFTAKQAGTYRLVQGWLIPVKRVKTWKERLEEHEITGRRELPPKMAIRFIHEGTAVTENLARLFEKDPETGELKSKIVKKVILDLDDDRGKVAILYGDWTLGAGEIFELDPDTTTITPPTDDAYTHKDYPNTNYGSRDNLELSYDLEEIYVRFDLSGLGSVSVSSALLRLYYWGSEGADPSGKNTGIYRVLESWDEGTITWNNAPSASSTATDTVPIPSSTGVWVEWDVTDDVQGMVNGTLDNYGWKIAFLESVDAIVFFRSKEYDGYDPELYVEYAIAKELSESISLGDVITRSPSKPVLETMPLLDAKIVTVSAVKSELLSLSDILSRVWSIYRAYHETLSVSDVKQLQSQLIKAESLILSDIYSRIWNIYRVLEELASLTDKVAKSIATTKAETITLTDTIKVLKVFLRVLEEVITLTDTLAKSVATRKTEMLSLSDLIYKIPTIPLSETLTISDIKQIHSELVKLETISMLDQLQKLLSTTKAETLSLTDLLEKIWSIYRTYMESLSFIDRTIKSASVTKTELASLAGLVSKSTSITKEELVSLTDILTRIATLIRELTEALTLADIVIKHSSALKTELIQLASLITKLPRIPLKEMPSLTDSILKAIWKILVVEEFPIVYRPYVSREMVKRAIIRGNRYQREIIPAS